MTECVDKPSPVVGSGNEGRGNMPSDAQVTQRGRFIPTCQIMRRSRPASVKPPSAS